MRLHQVSAVLTEEYTMPQMREAVRRHFEALDADALFRPGMRVVLKPNLLMKRDPAEATTTHPTLVRAVAEHLQEELGVTDIVIADSPGDVYTRASLEGTYKATGMKAAAEKAGITANLETGYKAVTSCDLDGLCNTFNLIDPICEADVVINLPKLKTHAMMMLSAGVKNLFGCIPGLQKAELHFRFPQEAQFSQMLVELSQVVKPALTIVDAVVAMEGDGPSSGILRPMGWTFAARNPHALDVAMCEVTGIDPDEVPTVAYAKSLGLAPNIWELEYLADGLPRDVEPFIKPKSRSIDFAEFMPGPLKGLRRWMSPRPVVKRAACIGCGRCVEACPAKTIALHAGKAVIDYKDCIKCYCCHEMCPERAITIKRSSLLGL